jgi:hypothetical protein
VAGKELGEAYQRFIDSLPLAVRLFSSTVNLELPERQLIPSKHNSIEVRYVFEI